MNLKFSIKIALLLGIGFSGCKNPSDEVQSRVNPSHLQSLFSYSNDSRPLVFVHRGGPAVGFPENCIETFEHTYQQTGAFIEVDPRYSDDGVIVLFHDETLARCSTGNGKVSSNSYSDLEELRLLDLSGSETPFTIPTLEDAFDWAKGKSVLLLDRKDVSAEERARQIQSHNAYSYAMVSAYNFEEAKRIHQLDPLIMMQVFMPDLSAFKKFEETKVPWKNVIASISKVPLTQEHAELIEKIHSKGTKVVVASYGMIDRPYLEGGISKNEFERRYRRILDFGVDIIQCDLPIEVTKVILGESL